MVRVKGLVCHNVSESYDIMMMAGRQVRIIFMF